MRIDKIELCNLASFEGEQIIDFRSEPLRSAGLFAITGNDGAGKSSLLDAVCLALYGRAPRFGQHGAEVPENAAEGAGAAAETAEDEREMLHRGKSQGYCNVCFSLTDGTSYEASWNVRSKHAGTFEPAVRWLSKIYPKRERLDVTDVTAKVTELTGMDYEQFTRTVVLAQSSFASFLFAKPADKSMILEKLAGTELYGRISRIVNEETALAQKRYDELLKVMEGIALQCLDDEELQKLNERMTLYRGQQMRDETTLKRIDEQLKWYADYEDARNELERTKMELFETQRANNTLSDKRQVLERYDSVLPFQELYHAIRQTEQVISRLKKDSAAKQQQLGIQKQKQMEALKYYRTAENRQAELQTNYEHQLPLLNHGHSLQGEISAIRNDIKKKEEQLAHYRDAMATQGEALSVKEIARDDNMHRLALVNQRAQAIAMHRPMIESMENVKALLRQANEMEKELAELKKSLLDDNKLQKEYKLQALKHNEEGSALESKLQSLKDELKIHDQANHGLNSVDLQRQFARLMDLHRRSQSAMSLWKRIASEYSEVEDKENEIRRREISLTTLDGDHEKLAQKLAALVEARDVLRMSYMLSQSDNIKELRRQLREGNACPVCGATHHPYHSETEQELGRLLTDLETNYNASCEKVGSVRKQLQQIQQQQADEQGRLQMVKDYLQEIRSKLNSDVEEWRTYQDMDHSFKDCTPSVNREMRQSLLLQMLDNSEREIKRQLEINEQFDLHQNAINNLNQKIRNTTEELSANTGTLSEVVSTQRALDALVSEKQSRIEKLGHDLTYIMNEADKLITLPLWKDQWSEGHDSFLQKLTTLAEDWADCMKSLNATQQQEFKLQEEVNALQMWISDKKRLVTDWEQDVLVLKQTINAKEQQLRRMFGELTPDQALQQQQETWQKAIQEAQECRKLYEEALQEQQIMEGQLKSVAEQQQKAEDHLRETNSELDMLISKFNNDHSTLQYFELEKLFNDSRDWRKLRETILESDAELQESKYKFEAASQRMLELQQMAVRPSEDSSETLQSLQKQREVYTANSAKVTADLNKTETRLNMHRTAVDLVASYEEEKAKLQEEAQQWKQLDDIIGSADGKKFREPAQLCIFQILVGCANRYLHRLHSRYRLKAGENSLCLDVIDRDMFSQIRSVQTLSGSEVFRVSLALSLGLSALASNNADVANYFIDEGMNNMDNQELDDVIPVLEQLCEAEGCKIGVLSHAEQVRNRVFPKIQLVKVNGGKSCIEED